jgi:hypothetical protein
VDCAEAIPGTVMTVARAATIQVFTVLELRCIGVLLVSRFLGVCEGVSYARAVRAGASQRR